MELKEFITQWVINFLKNKDLLNKKIASVERGNFFAFKIDYKDRILSCFSKETLELDFLGRLNQDEYIWITTINSKENFDFLVKNWAKLAAYKNLTICFINPFSATDTKWSIKPYVHNSISEHSSLELGLKAMSNTVEEISIEAFKSKI